MDDARAHALIFYLNARDELVASMTFPGLMKKKSIYFLKNEATAVPDKLDQHLILGELPPTPLDFLSSVLEEVYLPLLSNPKNMEAWPDVVANDIVRHFQSLNGAVHVIAGKSKGKTVLPLPDHSKLPNANDKKSKLHLLETTVINWTHLVQDVLKQNVSKALETGPMVEIDFWVARTANLSYIKEQLTNEKVLDIEDTLSQEKSSYFSVYKMMRDDLEEGRSHLVLSILF